MKSLYRTLIFCSAMFLLILLSVSCQDATVSNDYQLDDLELVWADEFEDPDINLQNWVFEIGGHGWGNAELEYYTDRPQNAYIENGNLVIQALQESYEGSDYTSARMITQGKQSFQYGRVEARIKLPTGKGIWPAFWLLGDNISTVGWPQCGEVDIMEHLGNEISTTHGTLHGPGYYGGSGIGVSYKLAEGQFKDDFHVFAIEWIPGQIQWFVDGNLYHTVTKNSIPQNGEWVFDQPFFILLNVAVGGNWPGVPNDNTVFPQQMLVDYVRVYQAEVYPPMADSASGMLAAGIPVKFHISQINLSAQERGNNWQTLANLEVIDEFGNPVKDVVITGKWSGLPIKGKEFKAKTNADGILGPLKSPLANESGKIFFCIETIVKEGYVFDITNGESGCKTIEYEH